MKYIIVSKDDFEGTSISDVNSPQRVTEIATELIITRLGLFDLLSTGRITINDTVVAIKERHCLYSSVFKNVISYQDYKLSPAEADDVIDLVDPGEFYRLCTTLPYKPFYGNYERDKLFITQFMRSDLREYDLTNPFVALVIRTRGAWPEKNMSSDFWRSLIERLTKNNISVFVFGKETKVHAIKNVQYIENYQDWCTIVQHINCKHIASTMTGGVYPAMIFGHSDINLTIIDNTHLMARHGGDPSFYSDCVNFTSVKFNFIDYNPSITEMYDRIKQDL